MKYILIHALAINHDLISKKRIVTNVLFFRNVEILPMKVLLSRKKHICIQRTFLNGLIESCLALFITTADYAWHPKYSHIKSYLFVPWV